MVQQASYSPTATDGSVSFNNSGPIPSVGEVITTDQQNSYLRRVTSLSTNGNQIIAQTEPVALNEVYQDLEFSTTVNMIPIPARPLNQRWMSRELSSKAC